MSDPFATALRGLPTPTPPYSVWPRLQQELRRRQRVQRLRRVGYALAAGLALALVLPLAQRPAPLPTAPGDAIVQNLIDESAALERWLAAAAPLAPDSAQDTALRVEITDRLQWIDELLERPASSTAARTALWQERVLLLRELAALASSDLHLAAGEANPTGGDQPLTL